jgi:hypothetical protein
MQGTLSHAFPEHKVIAGAIVSLLQLGLAFVSTMTFSFLVDIQQSVN